MADEPPSPPDAATASALPYRRSADVRETASLDRQTRQMRFFLRNLEGEVFILSEQDHFIWTLLDGTKSFVDLETAFRDRFGFGFTEEDLAAFLTDLLPLGLIERRVEAGDAEPAPTAEAAWKLMRADTPAAESPPLAPGEVRFPSRLGWRAHRKEPFTLVLGDPDRWLRFLSKIFWPIRRLAWLLLPFTFLSILIMIKHNKEYTNDWLRVVFNISWWPTLWLGEHIQNLITRVVEGMVIIGYGGAVHQFRIRAFLGVLLRGFVDESSLRIMPVRCKLWAHASTLLVRVTTFNAGMWVWIYYRDTHPTVSLVGLFCSVLGAFTFLATACPLLPQEGYHILATYTGQPDLMMRAYRVLGLRLRGRSAPAAMSRFEMWGLVWFALGIGLVSFIYVGYVWIGIDESAVQAMGGFGALIVIGVYVLSAVYFFSLRRFARKMRALQQRLGSARGRAEMGGGPPPSPGGFRFRG